MYIDKAECAVFPLLYSKMKATKLSNNHRYKESSSLNLMHTAIHIFWFPAKSQVSSGSTETQAELFGLTVLISNSVEQ